jgi:tRNA(Ser,Leu) C12 N-acetylase TAN1
MFEFNLLVTYAYDFLGARREIARILALLGDEAPTIRRTLVKGIIGVITSLDVHELSKELRRIASGNPKDFWFTQRWIPIDLWTASDIPSMREGVRRVAKIGAEERWMMVVEKRRYETHHTPEIIKELAELVEAKVDLKKPDRILRVDILGPYAGISLLRPGEVFSALRRGPYIPLE